MIKLKIWKMEDEEQVAVFQGQIKEEKFQFVQDGDTTYMVQLDMPTARKAKGRSVPPKTSCPYCGKSFVAGRGINRHLKSCSEKPKPGRPKRKITRRQQPKTKTPKAREAQPEKEVKEQTLQTK